MIDALILSRLKTSRIEARITRVEIADSFDVEPRTIAAWERGEARITAVSLGTWARIVGKDPNYFYGEGPR